MPKYTFFPCPFQQFQPPKELVFRRNVPLDLPEKGEKSHKKEKALPPPGIFSPFDGSESPFRENKTPKDFTQSAFRHYPTAVPTKSY